MDCVVLAGGVPSPGDTLYPHTRGLPKASVEVAGKTIGQRVVDALTDAESIDRIVVVGDIEVSSPKLAAVVPTRQGLVDNFVAGVEALQGRGFPGPFAAACTSDIPLLTGAMVDWFVASARGPDATAGVIRREAVDDHYPEYPNSYWRLTDGEFTAVDFIVFRPSTVPELASRLRPLADARKNVIRTARLLGPGLLLRFLLHRLSLDQAERYISRALDIDVRLIDVPHPEMGLDVDEAVHLVALQNALS
ncbi:MAG: NTP transferase domain-containing protein [Acidimicrobiia bacterium]